MQMIKDIKQLFSFSNFEPVTNETNILPIEEISLLPTLLPIAILERKDDNFLSSITLDNDAPPIRWSTKIYHTPNRYRIVSHYLALSTMTQTQIYKLLRYNQVIYSPKTNL